MPVVEGLCETREVFDAIDRLARLLYECDGRCTIVLRTPDTLPAYGNLVCNRSALYKLLGASSDREAYLRVIRALESPRTPNEASFSEYYEAVQLPLRKLPAVRFYDCDGGPYLTGGVIVACKDEACNASIHRMMLARDRLVARVVPRHLHRMLRESGGRLPVAVVLGAHPAFELAAATSPPYGVYEAFVASSLGWRGELCRTPRYGIPVPCDARVVIEGVLGGEYEREGPFADILLLCDRVREQPVFKPEQVYVSKVYEPAVWQVLPGGEEHRLLMGFPREALIWDAVRRAVGREPRVRLARSGGSWLTAFISFEEIERHDAKIAVMAAFSAHPSLKIVVVTLNDVNIDSEVDVNWAIATRLSSPDDLVIINNVRVSSLDPSSKDGVGVKLGIIALPQGDKERFTRPRLVG